jgi:hypothetical protein
MAFWLRNPPKKAVTLELHCDVHTIAGDDVERKMQDLRLGFRLRLQCLGGLNNCP